MGASSKRRYKRLTRDVRVIESQARTCVRLLSRLVGILCLVRDPLAHFPTDWENTLGRNVPSPPLHHDLRHYDRDSSPTKINSGMRTGIDMGEQEITR
jgi:hypothetical protein